MQVILTAYRSVAEVLANFDLDCCAFAFEPGAGRVVCTPRAQCAVVHGANIVNTALASPSYCPRLEKSRKPLERSGMCWSYVHS